MNHQIPNKMVGDIETIESEQPILARLVQMQIDAVSRQDRRYLSHVEDLHRAYNESPDAFRKANDIREAAEEEAAHDY